jgi:transcriptional regulator GlxA family with amidase domain
MGTNGFRLGIYVFKDVEIVDFAAPHGVFSVARRFDPELEAFLVADAMRPVQAQAGFTVLPNYSFADRPAMDAFLVPGGFGTRQEIRNGRLHEFVRSQPESTLLTSVCTGSWIYAEMGLLDGIAATSRKEPDRVEAGPTGKVPIDRLADIAPACRISRARVVDAGRIITGGGIASGMELGFHLLRRAGYAEDLIGEVARVMEYQDAYKLYRDDVEVDPADDAADRVQGDRRDRVGVDPSAGTGGSAGSRRGRQSIVGRCGGFVGRTVGRRHRRGAPGTGCRR